MIENLSEIETVALTIFGEARGEPIQGQIAVGCVIRNRVNKRKKTYQEICLAPLQFSCWNKDDPNRPVLEEWAQKLIFGEEIKQAFLNQAIWIAQGIVNERIIDNTRNSDHYLTNELYAQKLASPSAHWAKNLNMKTIIGRHTFLS